MGRRKYTIRRVRWHLQIPETVAAEVELLLLDPFWQQPKWGAKSELVTQLLQEWLNSQTDRPFQPVPLDDLEENSP